MTRPPIAGPATSVVWNSTMLSESAPGKLIVADEVRNDRRARRRIDGADQRRERDDAVQPEQRRVAAECAEREQSRARGEAELGDEQHAAAIESVGDRTAAE